MRLIKTILISAAFSSTVAQAGIIQSTNQAEFNLTPEAFTTTTSFTFGNLTSVSTDLTLDAASGVGPSGAETSSHAYQNFTGLLSGSEYVLNGDENFDILFSSPASAFAMDYVDTSANSSFTLTFYNGASNIGTSVLNPNIFNTASFVGFISDTDFDKVTVRESSATNSDEFFQFYTATPVLEPATAGLLTLGLGGLFGLRRRR